MLNTFDYVRFYTKVHHDEMANNNISIDNIRSAVQDLNSAYKPNPASWTEEKPCNVDYNDPAHRCAYLFKYAPLHTFMVQDVLYRALVEGDMILSRTIAMNLPYFRICSLGGGPGIDVLGVLSTLHHRFGLFHCSAQIVESMPGWESTFKSVLMELQLRCRGLSYSFNSNNFVYSYLEADLLSKKMDIAVHKAIGSAHLITMVKFISSVSCKDTEQMLRKVLKSMRPGAILLFIDNAAGGFGELVSRLGSECGMRSVFGPFKHVPFIDGAFDVVNYGLRSCYKTRVTVHIMMKPYPETKRKIPLHPASQNFNGPLIPYPPPPPYPNFCW